MSTRYDLELVILQKVNWVYLLNKNPRENLESRQVKRKSSKSFTIRCKNPFLLGKEAFLNILRRQDPSASM